VAKKKKNSISVNSSEVNIKSAWKEVPVSIIPRTFLKCCLTNAEGETQDDSLWAEIGQSGEGASSSGNSSATELFG
jgi:hypothetical protein